MKKLILLLLTASCLLAQNINVQKNGSNALTGSFVVPSGVSVSATGTGQIIATNIPASPVGNSILAGNGSGGFQNVTIGSGLSFTGNTLSSTSGGTVTSFSVTTNNGVVASVINSTTTPVLNISLGAITPTTVNGNTISTGTGTLNLGSYTITLAQSGTLGSAAYTATTAYDPAGAAAAVSANSLQKANNLSDLASTSTARTNLGVTATGQDTTYAYRANNLSDLASASTARTNLGLGTVATQTAPSGTSSQLLANNGTGGFSNVTVGSGLSYSGGTLSSTAGGGSVTQVNTSGSVNGITLTGGPITTTGTITLGGTLSGVSLTTQVSGTLPVANGGTGVTTSTGSGSNVLSTSPILVTPNLGQPTYADLTNATKLPLSTGVTGTLPIANGGTGTATPATVAGTGISVSGSFPNQTITNTGVTNIVAGSNITVNASSGSVQISSTNPGGTVTSVSGTGSVNGITLTGTVTSSGSLTLGGTLSNINLASQVTGTLPIANGGTGVTTSSGANSVVLRDSNSNVFGNNFFKNFLSQAASGTTITLTASSSPDMVITGSGGQVIKLPDATTLPNGNIFTFNNNQSSGTITVQNNSGTTIATLQSGSFIDVVLLSNATSTGTWDYHNVAPSNASWSTNTLSWAGSYTNGTWNGNTIGVGYGGTGTTGLTGYVYGNGTSAMTASTTIPTSALSGTVSNAQLANSAITIAGTSTSLGGTISQDTITGLSTTGLVKRTGANTLAIAASGTDYAPATSGSSLLYGNGSGGFSNVTIGTGVSFSGGTLSATGTGGTVTSFSSGSLSPLFTTSVATSTSTPALSFSLSNAAANTILGNNTSSSAAPAYNTVSSYLDNAFSSTQGAILYRSGSAWVALPAGTSGQLLTTGGAGANPSWTTYTGSSSITTVGTLTSGAIGTGFTAISNSALANSSITFGSTSQALGSTVSALNNVSLGQTTAAAGTFTSLTATGTTTLATSLSGLLKATSGVVSTATAGTDYVVPSGSITGTAGNVTGTVAVANGGTGQTTAAAAQRSLTPATSTISASAIDWSLSNSFYKTLAANTTFTFSNAQDGQVITICLLNTTSNYTVTWPTIKWAGGTAPTMTTGAKYDVYTIYYNATVGAYFGSYVQNF